MPRTRTRDTQQSSTIFYLTIVFFFYTTSSKKSAIPSAYILLYGMIQHVLISSTQNHSSSARQSTKATNLLRKKRRYAIIKRPSLCRGRIMAALRGQNNRPTAASLRFVFPNYLYVLQLFHKPTEEGKNHEPHPAWTAEYSTP